MDAKTLTALQESIAHWERNVAAKQVDDVSIQSDDCALCAMFAKGRPRPEVCGGCPVTWVNGQKECEGTPYYDARFAYYSWDGGASTRKAFRKAAQAEVDFLKSLLPQDAPA